MISMGPIGHSICSNYRKPIKILFYLRLVQVRRALPNSGSDSGDSLPVVAFYSTLGKCQLHCNIVAVIPLLIQECHTFFNVFNLILLTLRYIRFETFAMSKRLNEPTLIIKTQRKQLPIVHHSSKLFMNDRMMHNW